MPAKVEPGGVISLAEQSRELYAPQSSGGRLLKYDPAEVLVIWGALPVHEGIASGTFLTIEREKPSWRLIKGTDGEGTRVRTNDFSARVQLTVRAGSWVNDALSSSSAADDLSGTFSVPLTIRDANGRSLYVAPLAFLEQPADAQYADTESNVTWVFVCDSLLPYTGGLDRASPAP